MTEFILNRDHYERLIAREVPRAERFHWIATADVKDLHEIKIIRGDLKNPQVYIADVSTVEGLKNSTLQIYPNDIIYIDSGSKIFFLDVVHLPTNLSPCGCAKAALGPQ